MTQVQHFVCFVWEFSEMIHPKHVEAWVARNKHLLNVVIESAVSLPLSLLLQTTYELQLPDFHAISPPKLTPLSHLCFWILPIRALFLAHCPGNSQRPHPLHLGTAPHTRHHTPVTTHPSHCPLLLHLFHMCAFRLLKGTWGSREQRPFLILLSHGSKIPLRCQYQE